MKRLPLIIFVAFLVLLVIHYGSKAMGQEAYRAGYADAKSKQTRDRWPNRWPFATAYLHGHHDCLAGLPCAHPPTPPPTPPVTPPVTPPAAV